MVGLRFQEKMIMAGGSSVSITYFEHRSWHKYTRVPRGQDEAEVKSLIDLVLVKKAKLRYVQDVMTVRGMGRGLSDHHVVLCKVKLVPTWIKSREVVNGARRIRNEKWREHQYMEGYTRCLKSKSIDWDLVGNVEQMWEQVKQVVIDSAREVCGSARVEV